MAWCTAIERHVGKCLLRPDRAGTARGKSAVIRDFMANEAAEPVGATRARLTFASAGIERRDWQGLIGPRGMPKPIIDKVAAKVQGILRAPTGQDRLFAMGLEMIASTPEALGRRDRVRGRALREGRQSGKHQGGKAE
jgi:hypothetical protein